jgi:uncharacterized protein
MRRSLLGFSSGTAIGMLGGLIGLGGGEFRLPVLTSLFGYAAREAVPLNLVISLITLLAALVVRAQTLSLAAVAPHAVEVAALGLGGIVGARWSARLLTRLSDYHLEHTIAWLLAEIGVLLIVEALLPGQHVALISYGLATLIIISGVLFGIINEALDPWSPLVAYVGNRGIGAVAALLGVAGGELLIPTLILVYGADIRSAGTASLMISIVTVVSGLLR